MTDTRRDPSGATNDRSATAGSPPAPIDSRDLLQGHRQVVIVHGGQEYRLQLTHAGKLILTK